MLCGAALAFEWERSRGRNFDSFSIFLAIFFLQCLGPGAIIYTCLALHGGGPIELGNTFFDRVFGAVNGWHLLLVLVFMGAFLVISWLTYRAMLPAGYPPAGPDYRLSIARPALKFIVVLGLISGAVLLYALGGSLEEGYRALARFRNSDPEIVRTFLTANLFSLTQTFLLIGFLGLFLADRWRVVSPRFFAWAAIVGIFALLCVSRRSLLIPAILVLFTLMLAGRRPKFWQMAALGLAGATVIFGGKQFYSYLARDVEQVVLPSRGPLKDTLYVASDLGITVTESIGTVALIDLPPRLGVDHVWSVLRRIPEGAVGIEDPFPERIVRHTTAVFMGSEDQDIPPGWMGMMWLDFRWFGPVIYGLIFGAGLAIIERARWRCVIDLQASAVFALGLFVYCLPLNSGSMDFTFSVDMMILALLIFFVLRLKPLSSSATERATVSA